ncbi:uncharacterized protein LOC128558824 [Mercenaria mercenaria]|uniref:uncharacterized protein LOC128558824 n=1 Tax=Mercenaria mercenaria TaxID=6596 RepID=UPI00234F1A65|nr:uncharacterized protein LOC128558824 [Mercenaria mercenaria]
MSGDRGDVKEDCVNDWKRKLPTLCEGYHEKGIMNMDKTGLFYRDTMRNTFYFKGDDCAGGKRSKERITVALCARLTGEKMKPILLHEVKEINRQPAISGSELLKQLNILIAIYWINNSWSEVEESTIRKCFVKSGFGKVSDADISDKESSDQSVNSDTVNRDDDDSDDDDIPLAAMKMSYGLFGCSFQN